LKEIFFIFFKVGLIIRYLYYLCVAKKKIE